MGKDQSLQGQGKHEDAVLLVLDGLGSENPDPAFPLPAPGLMWSTEVSGAPGRTSNLLPRAQEVGRTPAL